MQGGWVGNFFFKGFNRDHLALEPKSPRSHFHLRSCPTHPTNFYIHHCLATTQAMSSKQLLHFDFCSPTHPPKQEHLFERLVAVHWLEHVGVITPNLLSFLSSYHFVTTWQWWHQLDFNQLCKLHPTADFVAQLFHLLALAAFPNVEAWKSCQLHFDISPCEFPPAASGPFL